MRLKWPFDNPNALAAVVAVGIALLVAAAVAATGWRRWLIWAAIAALLVVMAQTGSRAGWLAIAVALGWVVMAKGRAALPVAGWTVAVAAVLLVTTQSGSRWAASAGDASILNRHEVWKAGAVMAWDCPWGMGLGNSGAAFSAWYAPLSLPLGYSTLVNSPLTLAVELGWWAWALWFFLLAALPGWARSGPIDAPGRGRLLLTGIAAAWLCLGVALGFSSLHDRVAVQVLASLLLAAGIATGWAQWRSRLRTAVRWGLICSGAATAALLLCGALLASRYPCAVIGYGPTQATIRPRGAAPAQRFLLVVPPLAVRDLRRLVEPIAGSSTVEVRICEDRAQVGATLEAAGSVRYLGAYGKWTIPLLAAGCGRGDATIVLIAAPWGSPLAQERMLADALRLPAPLWCVGPDDTGCIQRLSDARQARGCATTRLADISSLRGR